MGCWRLAEGSRVAVLEVSLEVLLEVLLEVSFCELVRVRLAAGALRGGGRLGGLVEALV